MKDFIVDNSFAPPDPPVRLLAAYQQSFPDHELVWLVRAPGRDTWIAAGRSGNETFTVAMPDLDARTTFSLQSARVRRTVLQRPLPRWARYPAGVTLTVDNDSLDVIGLNMVVMGSEPPGPQYDYAVGIAFAVLWYEVWEQHYTMDHIIEIVDKARREYVEET